MIEAFFRSLEHQAVHRASALATADMNTLDTVAAVRRHVTFYVDAHNRQIPHSALNGRTPDEVYFGDAEHIPAALEARSKTARQARLEVNRALSCTMRSGARS